MNRYFHGVTLGVTLAGGLALSVAAQHGYARADGGQPTITIDSSSLPAAGTADADHRAGQVLPSNFTLMNPNSDDPSGAATDLHVLPSAGYHTSVVATSTDGTTTQSLPTDFTPVNLNAGN